MIRNKPNSVITINDGETDLPEETLLGERERMRLYLLSIWSTLTTAPATKSPTLNRESRDGSSTSSSPASVAALSLVLKAEEMLVMGTLATR